MEGKSLIQDQKTDKYIAKGLTKTAVNFQIKETNQRFHVAVVKVKQLCFEEEKLTRTVGAPAFVPENPNFHC